MTTNVKEDDGVFPIILEMLREECKKSDPLVAQQTFSTAVQTLLRILRNVLNNPTEVKYKSIRLQNRAFSQKVWRHDGAQQFLQATGWVIVMPAIFYARRINCPNEGKLPRWNMDHPSTVLRIDDSIFLSDDTQVQQAVTELEKHVSVARTPPEGAAASPTSAMPKELTEARRKQLEQMKKDKEHRRMISEQIRADRQETNSRPTRDSRATERRFSGPMKRFEDIGVNLNGGGG